MFQINAHILPTESATQFGEVEGAYAVLYINYADIDGAFALAKYYIEDDGWQIDKLEEEYFIINSPDDIEENQLEFYNQALETGYSIIFHTYEKEGDDFNKEV